jgi:hypothetical protein
MAEKNKKQAKTKEEEDEEDVFSEEDQAQVKDRLKSLGYID